MKKISLLRQVSGSFMIAVLAAANWNFITLSNFTFAAFLAAYALAYYKSGKIEAADCKRFQYKTASILSFLLPVSAIIFSFVFTGTQINVAGSEAEQAGAAIGGAIGGTFVIILSFIFGLSLGIVFYLLSRKK